MIFFGLEIGSWAEWISGISTFGATSVSLWIALYANKKSIEKLKDDKITRQLLNDKRIMEMLLDSFDEINSVENQFLLLYNELQQIDQGEDTIEHLYEKCQSDLYNNINVEDWYLKKIIDDFLSISKIITNPVRNIKLNRTYIVDDKLRNKIESFVKCFDAFPLILDSMDRAIITLSDTSKNGDVDYFEYSNIKCIYEDSGELLTKLRDMQKEIKRFNYEYRNLL